MTFTISIFIDHIIKDLNISRTLISSLYTIATIAGSFGQPIIGRMIDRYGPQKVFLIVGCLLGASCILMGNVFNIILLTIGFTGVRLFGQGGLFLVSQNAINRWWVRKRGWVQGISGIFVSIFSLGVISRVLNRLIEQYDWRTAYQFSGIFVLLMIIPLGVFLLRNRPEEFGLNPDGVHDEDQQHEIKPILEVNWTRQEAMHAPVFWVLSVSIALSSALFSGMFFHLVGILNENGLGSSAAVGIYLPIAFIRAIITYGSGLMIDRLPVQRILALSFVIQGLALGIMPSVTSLGTLNIFGVLVGIADGLFIPVVGVIWATYFGRNHLGSITGVTTALFIIGSALGPLLFGIARDLSGNFISVTLFSGVGSIILAIIVMITKKPNKKMANNPIL